MGIWPSVQAQSSLLLQAQAGRIIHDATYLPRPPYWPDDWDWDGTGLNSSASYRYGPSLIRYNTNHLHFWACSEGDEDQGIADFIRYKNSTNGGISWSDETIALKATVGSEDGTAVCDPDVIRIGSYYYMAYTATDDTGATGGLNNHVFVARSTRPDKNFQKWNGSGWGGVPKPIIRYNGIANKWGFGEPSMVVKGNTLYLYYTDFQFTARTRVATASASNPNWPSTLVQRGYAIYNRDWAEDQSAVKYLPEVNRFIATAIANRFTSNSYVHVWQSNDGLNFTPVNRDNVHTNILPTAHNLGMSGNFLGHAYMGNKEYIAYAYNGPEGRWGRWNTWLNKVIITGAGWRDVAPQPDSDFLPFIMLLLDD